MIRNVQKQGYGGMIKSILLEGRGIEPLMYSSFLRSMWGCF